jgi:hypothetical protein
MVWMRYPGEVGTAMAELLKSGVAQDAPSVHPFCPETSRLAGVNECNGDVTPTEPNSSCKNDRIAMKMIPAGATIAELEKKAADCEEKAEREAEPEATKLREEALLTGSGSRP